MIHKEEVFSSNVQLRMVADKQERDEKRRRLNQAANHDVRTMLRPTMDVQGGLTQLLNSIGFGPTLGEAALPSVPSSIPVAARRFFIGFMSRRCDSPQRESWCEI